MKVEHKLAPAVQAVAKSIVQQIQDAEKERLQALGAAREAEVKLNMMRTVLGQQLSIVQETEGLPQPIAPYGLSPDCTALVGEIADTPAPVVELGPAQVKNGLKAGA